MCRYGRSWDVTSGTFQDCTAPAHIGTYGRPDQGVQHHPNHPIQPDMGGPFGSICG